MKFVLAPDSFKGCMTAQQATDAMATGIKAANPHAVIERVPMADGGEGTTQTLVDALHGHLVKVRTQDPLGRPIKAQYGLFDHNQIAVIETSAASGIQYVNPKTTDPGTTSTYGTGWLIRDALDRHVKKIVIGLGGSATNDGGSGMAAALGARFLDIKGNELRPCGNDLRNLQKIDVSHMNPRLKTTPIVVASDVTNPLTGPHGASTVFGPQKGADFSQVHQLDRNLFHYAKIIKNDLDLDVDQRPGSGAAGGLDAGLMAFTNCHVEHGVKIVMELIDLKTKLQNADVVITGEGSIDEQTQYGKVPVGVSALAKRVAPHCKVVALGGHIGKNIDNLYNKGMDAILPILPGAMSLSAAIHSGAKNLSSVTLNLTKLLIK